MKRIAAATVLILLSGSIHGVEEKQMRRFNPETDLISLHYVERTETMLALKDVVEQSKGDLVPSEDILRVAGKEI